jgi:glycosyltransferase involved in cell wall biosynthesis
LSSAYGRIADELFIRRLSRHHEIGLFSPVGISYGIVELTVADEYTIGDWLAAHGEPSSPEAYLEMARGAQRRVPVYPGLDPGDFTGNQILPSHIRDFRPDMFWTASDPWPFQQVAEMAGKGMFVWGIWPFVDFEWNDPAGVLDHLSRAAVVVPTSVWLERRLRAIPGLNVTAPIRLGVNPKAFAPLLGDPDETGAEITSARLKRAMGLPGDCFLVGMVQMNQIERKPFGEQLEGFRIFRDSNPDVKAKLYLHTYPHTKDGYDLPRYVKELGLERDVLFANDYSTLIKGLLGYDDATMAKIYNTMDVLLQATAGDSPGMPILEAQAAGCPVVATDFVGIPEHVAGGELVRPAGVYRPPEKPQIMRAVPDPAAVCRGLEKVLNRGRAAYSSRARGFALKNSWDRVLADWLLMLEDLELDIDRRTLVPPAPAAGLSPLAVPS